MSLLYANDYCQIFKKKSNKKSASKCQLNYPDPIS